jgi:hypothetical protein
MPTVTSRPVLYTVLGLNRAEQALWALLLVGGGAAFVAWQVFVPVMRFSDADEQLFRAARHGDRAGIEHALAAGAGVNDASPLDGGTALFRAAAFGHTDAVRALIEHGADPASRAGDSRTALDLVIAARADEQDAATARALDDVAAALRGAEKRE